MEGTERPARPIEGNLKGKCYVGQLRGMTGADGDLPALHDITGCTT